MLICINIQDLYKYSGSGIGFNRKGSYSITLTAEKLYSINFTKENTKFCLSLHCLFVNGTEIIKFKAKDSEITAYPLCLGNISKDWSVDNMNKTGLKG